MPFLLHAIGQFPWYRHAMAFAVHALHIADVINLLAFPIRIEFRQGCQLLLGLLPAAGIIATELLVVFAGAGQYQHIRIRKR